MRFFDRLSNGWKLGKTSLKTIQENPTLLWFPIISTISLVIVTISFFGSGYLFFGEQILGIADDETSLTSLNIVLYLLAFLFYLINYFVIIFFNIGLVHCAKNALNGEEVSLSEGIRYAQSRAGTILAWSFLAATVGIILKTLQERLGAVGGIITGIIGMVWGIATFFVVPVLAYEDVTPIEAVKRSASIMKEKWGESIGANFSFGLFTLIGILFIAIPAGFLTGFLMHPIIGVMTGFALLMMVFVVTSAADMVFMAAIYQYVNNEPIGNFEGDILDDVFVQK